MNTIRGLSTIIIVIICTIFICKKIENKNLKTQIKLLSTLLLFWLTIRIIKYEFVSNEEIKKILWYLYYFPVLFTSTIFLSIGTFNNKNKKYTKILKVISIIGSSILCILVLTNDFHNLVFKINSLNYEKDYSYNIGYYLCFIWIFINILISIISATKGSKGAYKKQKVIILFTIFSLVLLYAFGYMFKNIIVRNYIKDFVVIYSLLYMLALIIVVYKEKYRLSIEESLYQEIEDGIKDKTIVINEIINNSKKIDKNELSYIKLLVSYCKCKSNLIVIQKNNEYYNEEELKVFIDNAFKDASNLGINGAVNIVNKFKIPIYTVSIIYEYLFNLFEYLNNYKNSNVLISIKKESKYINLKTMIDTKEKTIIDTDDNKLNIKTRGVSCIGICTKINTPKVEIYLPKEYSKKINIYVSSGDIKINKFKNANIKLKSSSGDVIVQNAELIDIKGTSGDIQLVKIESAKIDIISGDIKIKSLKKADLTSKSGIIKIENANLEVNSKIKTTSGDVTINKINKINIDTKTTSGNIKIKNNDKESEIKLKVSTVSGDIIIK